MPAAPPWSRRSSERPWRADPHLLRGRAGQAEVDDADTGAGQQDPQLVAGGVRGQRGDQHDVAPVGRGQQGGQTGATGPAVLHRLVDHGHRCVRAEPVDGPDQVAVEQGVADDDEGAAHATSPRRAGSSG